MSNIKFKDYDGPVWALVLAAIILILLVMLKWIFLYAGIAALVWIICYLSGWMFSLAIPGIILLIAVILRVMKGIICEN